MTKIMMLGDTHGDTGAYAEALLYAEAINVRHIFVLGDLGVFPYYNETLQYLEDINQMSREFGIHNYWVRGNHDDPDARSATLKYWPGAHRFGMLRSNIHLADRVHHFKMFGLQFLAVGGAVSIDRDWRVQQEKRDKTLYWPNETISEADMRKVYGWSDDRKVDVLLTHDCSDRTPFYTRLKADLDSKMNRQKIDNILRVTEPDFHFHGHMHTEYEWENRVSGNHWVSTYGLECNEDAMMHNFGDEPNNWIIFDTESKNTTWRLDG